MTQPAQPPPSWVAQARKFLVAVIGFAAEVAATGIVHGQAQVWLQTVIAVATAAGIYTVPNAPASPLLLTAEEWATRYGRHAKPPEPPVIQQEPDETWVQELKQFNRDHTATRPTPYPRELPTMIARSHIRRPHGATASLTARQVGRAYNYPLGYTGKGRRCGIVELGGGFGQADLDAYFSQLGLLTPNVTAVPVAGGANKSDGPNGADGEVLLDIEVAAAIAPAAEFRVYFAPNSDSGFLAAIEQAAAECDVVSISWGGPEDSWDPKAIDAFDAAFLAARQAGVVVFCAAGDQGSGDGEGGKHVDFPASSPNVIGCGGTRLATNSHGDRQFETVWNDNTTSSATGGGVSTHFPGRQVPDVAGNADPVTGYQVLVDGQHYVIGGTSAVAPLYAGLALLLSEAIGQPLGKKVDFLNAVLTNPGVCFDVTSGNNGAYRAGPGRDETTGFGVVDGGRLLAVLQDQVPDPAPVPTPSPTPTPIPAPGSAPTGPSPYVVAWAELAVTQAWRSVHDRRVARELLDQAGVQ